MQTKLNTMKNIIILLLIINLYNCKAQSTIHPLADRNVPENFNNVYFKDIDNDLDQFVGTWVFQDGNTSLTIVLEKLTQFFTGSWYDDRLIGEYKYVLNGTEIVNYLPRLNNPNVTKAAHSIKGKKIVSKYYLPECDFCATNQRRLSLNFADLERKYLFDSELILTYVNDNGIEKLYVVLQGKTTSTVPDNVPLETRVPYGEYILIKQD